MYHPLAYLNAIAIAVVWFRGLFPEVIFSKQRNKPDFYQFTGGQKKKKKAK